MTLNVEKAYDLELGVDYEKTAVRVAAQVLKEEKCPYEAEISLLLVSDEEIHRLNLEYRGIDSPTDVLSFPQIEYENPADFSASETQGSEYLNPDTGELFLGDIIISLDRVKEQAANYGHGTEREFAFLVAHSMLHLLGYDHMTEEDAENMETKQAQALTHLGIER